jgi:RND family efflux transporter MFP subunit
VSAGRSGADESSGGLFTLSQQDKVRCRISVPERDAPFINRGDAVELTFPSFEGEVLTTTVTRTSASLGPETRTMVVEAELPNQDGRLLPGMFGQATITAGAAATVSVLPARAVRFDGTGRAFVYVIHEDNTVAETQVQIGNDDGNNIAIVSGLAAGDRVVDAQLKRLTDGQRVRIIE